MLTNQFIEKMIKVEAYCRFINTENGYRY